MTYQDNNNDVFLTYNSVDYLSNRYDLTGVVSLSTLESVLKSIISEASGGSIIPAQNSAIALGQGIITKTSTRTFDETYNTLKAALENNSNLRIIAEVDHQVNATDIGMDLMPTRLIIFGNPNLGTPLMQNKQTTANDLPQKMLVWEDEMGVVKVAYNDPDFLKLRHNITDNDTVLETVSMALNNLSNGAAGL